MQTQDAKSKKGRPKKEAEPKVKKAKEPKEPKKIVTTATFKEEARHDWNSEVDVCQYIGSLINMIQAKTVLEIGVFEGETSIKMIEALKTGGYYAGLDINDYRKHKLEKPGVAVDFKLGESIGLLKGFPANHFDFIFVDGDHSWANILPEFKEVERVLASGGILAYHDSIHIEDVKKLMQYAAHYNYNVITLNTSEGRGLSILQRS
jgi:predicted O-methyltransferase YrrM